MKDGGSKQKGAAFERKVCGELSLWITGGKRSDCFWRSAMSGGRATVAAKAGKVVAQAGDVAAVSPEGHLLTEVFYVECRFYQDLELHRFLFQQGRLSKFWRETWWQAITHYKQPMLIAKQNRLPPLVLIRTDICYYGSYGSVVAWPGEYSCRILWLKDLVSSSLDWLCEIEKMDDKRGCDVAVMDA